MAKSKLILKTITAVIFCTSLTAVIAEAQNQAPPNPPPQQPKTAPQPATQQPVPQPAAPQQPPLPGAAVQPPAHPAPPQVNQQQQGPGPQNRPNGFKREGALRNDFRIRSTSIKKVFPKATFPSLDDEINEFVKTKDPSSIDFSPGSDDILGFCIFVAEKYQEKLKSSYKGYALDNYFKEVCSPPPTINVESITNPRAQIEIYKSLIMALLDNKKLTLDNLPVRPVLERQSLGADIYAASPWAKSGLSYENMDILVRTLTMINFLLGLIVAIKVFFLKD
ncbi:MAG: hypothetical protein ACXVAX_00680 [Pseudobdellovibrio sp.]